VYTQSRSALIHQLSKDPREKVEFIYKSSLKAFEDMKPMITFSRDIGIILGEDYQKKLEALDTSESQLGELRFRICVVGATKAGKSTLINAIVGKHVAPIGINATTALPCIIRHAPGVLTPKITFDSSILLRAESHLRDQKYSENDKYKKIVHSMDKMTRETLFNIEANKMPKFESTLDDLYRLNTVAHLCYLLGCADDLLNDLNQNWPLLEIEFECLRGNSSLPCSFEIIDTPSLEEKALEINFLRNVVEAAVKSSSACFAVVLSEILTIL